MKLIKLRKYRDVRGSLSENTYPLIFKTTKHFFVSKSKPGVVRGNHYHLRKSEWFYVIQGKCRLYIKDIRTGKKEIKTISDKQNIIVNINPNKAHAFKNVGRGEMILLALVSEVHNQLDPDTYPYKLI